MTRTSLAEGLHDYLQPTRPLGPSDAADIRDVEVAARLFDPHNFSFNTLLRREVSVLLGRRGSGKTALLNSYTYYPYLDKYFKPTPRTATSDFRSYDIVIDIATYRHFDRMQRLVVRDESVRRPVEAIVEDWENIVTDYFYATLVAQEQDAGRRSPAIERLSDYLRQDQTDYRRHVRELVWGVSLFDRIRQRFARSTRAPRMNRSEALTLALEHLQSTDRRALIVFDSMDEYDIDNDVFNRTLAALIRFIAHFNLSQDRVRIKLGLPTEIFPEVSAASANALKDLTAVDQLRWDSTELQQIAAHRYRLFLSLHDPDYALELTDLDLSKRHILRAFWERFFQKTHVNAYGAQEEPMTYILRHTQLLPRQLLMILQQVIIKSHATTGGYRRFTPEAIVEALEMTEPLIAREILHAFAHVYPQAEKLCKPVFANFNTVFSYDELEDRWRKRGRSVAGGLGLDFDMAQFGEMLIRMGIVGVTGDERERYYEADFVYDSLTPPLIGDGHNLCLHPIFSKHFNAAGNPRHKAIMPKAVLRSTTA